MGAADDVALYVYKTHSLDVDSSSSGNSCSSSSITAATAAAAAATTTTTATAKITTAATPPAHQPFPTFLCAEILEKNIFKNIFLHLLSSPA